MTPTPDPDERPDPLCVCGTEESRHPSDQVFVDAGHYGDEPDPNGEGEFDDDDCGCMVTHPRWCAWNGPCCYRCNHEGVAR